MALKAGPNDRRFDRTMNTPVGNPNRMRIALASGSPRRREIVKALDAAVDVIGSNGEEPSPESGESPSEYVQRLAELKARGSTPSEDQTIVIGADTSVVLDGAILGKPEDNAEAEVMLRALRGRIHGVITGVAVLNTATGICRTISRSSDVHLRQYTDEEMLAYIASGEPMDKAGAYAAQDQNFRPAIRIVGCYLNVVGLPLCDTISLLSKMGVEAAIRKQWKIPEECENCELSYAVRGQDR